MKQTIYQNTKNKNVFKRSQGLAKLALAYVCEREFVVVKDGRKTDSALRALGLSLFCVGRKKQALPQKVSSALRALGLSLPFAGKALDVYKNKINPRTDSALRALGLSLSWGGLVVTLVGSTIGLSIMNTVVVEAAPNQELNFQARLLGGSGELIPDGFYNAEFKLYNVDTGGVALWTETYLDSNGVTAGNDNRIRVENGYLTANLGSTTAFPSTIDWSQQLWLTLNIGGTTQTASPTWDGEMDPRLKVTAVPYAFAAETAENVQSTDTNTASTNSSNVSITSGDATGATSNSGDVNVDVGSGTATNGAINIGAGTNVPSAINIGQGGVAAAIAGDLTVAGNTTLGDDAAADTLTVNAAATFNGSLTVSTGNVFNNAGATLFSATAISDLAAGGDIGTAATTVDVATNFDITQTTAGQTLTLPDPTNTASGRIVYVNNIGSENFAMYGETIETGSSSTFIWNGSAWTTSVSFANTGVDTIGAIDGGTANANGATITGTTLFLQNASDSFPGLVSTSAQTFNGVKTFDDGAIITKDGLTITAGDLEITAGNITTNGVTRLTNAGVLQNITALAVNTTTATDDQIVVAVNPSGAARFDGTITNDDFTAARNFVLPDESGTFILSSTLGNTAFVQDGNSFGATAVLGTNDAQSLQFEVGGNSALTIADGGAISAQNETDSVTGFQVLDADGGTGVLTVDTTNERVGIGTNAPNYSFEVQGTVPDTAQSRLANIGGAYTGTSDQVSGLAVDTIFNPSSNSDLDLIGILSSPSNSNGNLNTGTATLSGFVAAPSFSGTGTVSGLVGYYGQLLNTSTGTVSNAYAVQVANAINPSGTITNNAAISVEDQIAGTNNTNILVGTTTIPAGNYSIYNSSTYANYFAGALTVDGLTTINDNLDVNGQAVVTSSDNSAFIVEAAGGNNTLLVDTVSNGVAIGLASGSPLAELDVRDATAEANLRLEGADSFGASIALLEDSVGDFGFELSNEGSSNTFRLQGVENGTATNFFSVTRNEGYATFNVGTGDDDASAYSFQNAAGTDVVTIGTVGGGDTLTVTGGNTVLGGNLTVSGSAAFERGTDFTTTGSSDDVDFGAVSLVRLTGASAQTITGIANGTDGEILTIINAGTTTATLGNEDTGSAAANRITTGTGADLSIIAGGSIDLVYDAAASLWRVRGAASTTGSGSYIDNQNATDQTANFRISGTGQANTSLLTPLLDVASAGVLGVGTNTATALTLGQLGVTTTNAGAFTVDELLTGSLGATISGAAISLNNDSNFVTNINTGTSSGAVNIATGTGANAIGIGNANSTTTVLGVTNINTSGSAATTIGSATSALTVQGTATFNDLVEFTDEINQTIPSGTPNYIGSVSDATNLNGVKRITTVGNYLYATNLNGDSVSIYDITEPESPAFVGSVVDSVNLDRVRDIEVVGNYAYTVSMEYNGNPAVGAFSVLDISDPTSPSVVATLNDAGYDGARGIWVSGRYAYITAEDADQLSIIDIADPTNPVEVGSLVDTGGINFDYPYDIVVSGNYAYVAVLNEDALTVVDISDPTSPSVAGSVSNGTTLNGAHSVFLRDRYAYVAASGYDGFTVVDVSDPTLPAIVGSDTDGVNLDFPHSVEVVGDYALSIGAISDTFAVVDITNPTAPSIIGSRQDVTNHEAPADIAVKGQYAYVSATDTDSIAIYKLGGAKLTVVETGYVSTTTLNVQEQANIRNLVVNDALNVGFGGIQSNGGLAVSGDSRFGGNLIVQNETDASVGVQILDAAGNSIFAVDTASEKVAFGTFTPGSISGQVQIVPENNARIGLLLQGASGQTGDLLAARNSAGSTIARITADGGAVFNEQGSADADFRVEGDTSQNLLFVDASADTVNIGGDLITDQTTINLLNTTATTVNAFGDATDINIGAVDGDTRVSSDDLFVGFNGAARLIGAGTAGFSVISSNQSGASTNTGGLTVRSGNASGSTSNSGALLLRSGTATGNSGAVAIDAGSASGTAGEVNIGEAFASAINIGRVGFTTSNLGSLTVGQNLTVNGSGLFQNTSNSTSAFAIRESSGAGGAALLEADTTNFLLKVAPTQFLSSGSTQNFAVSGSITGVDSFSTIAVDATATDVTVTLPAPAAGGQVVGRVIYVTAVNGSEDFTLSLAGTSIDISMKQNSTATLIWNGAGWTAAGASSSTDLQSAYNNTLTSAGGAELILNASGGAADGLTIRNNDVTPISGGILEIQSSIGTNLFSVNNFADEYAANGGAENSVTFGAAWQALSGTTVTRNTTELNLATGTGSVDVNTNAVNEGVRNNLATPLATSTSYAVSFTAKVNTGTLSNANLDVYYSRNGGGDVAACANRSSADIVSTQFTKFTCIITTDGTSPSNADLIIRQLDATNRNIYIDNLSIVENNATSDPDNVQIGGGQNGGPVTLFTLDRSSSPPVADGNETYLGSMYYDTVTGRIQCYEADGWGACGSAPNNYVNLNPEYPGSVLNGTGVGTMTADFCARETGVLNINTGFCAEGEARNYYNWTSPQATEQEYSIYITYQLPAAFKAFDSNNTVQLTARTDNTTTGSVSYEMFRNEGGEIVACGSETTVTSSADTWQTVGINGDEATGCGFSTASADNFVIFKINMKARSNANVYASTLEFTSTGQ